MRMPAQSRTFPISVSIFAPLSPRLKEIICYYQRPTVGLRSLLCLVQCGFPFFAGVVLCLGSGKDAIGDEVAMRCASVSGCSAGTIKLLHWRLADRTKEGP